MFESQAISLERIALIVIAVCSLLLASYFYNLHIDNERKIDLDGPGRVMYVVIGAGYTLAIAATVWWMLFGLIYTLWFLVVLGICFGAAGAPMILGALHRNALRRQRDREERAAKEATEKVKRLNNGDAS